MRVVIDQDISPTEHLTNQLPEEWDVSVGIHDPHTALSGVNIAIVTSRIDLGRKVIESASELKIIGKLGTGIDNIDHEATADEGITVTHTPGLNAMSVAELTLGLMIAAARRFTESRRRIEAGEWRSCVTLGTQITGKTVGIVGFGNVGKRFASLLAGFNVDVQVHDPFVPDIDAELVGGKMVGLDQLLTTSDMVTITAELTSDTRGLFDSQTLDRMKDSAIIVNTARGEIIEQTALSNALKDGKIAGAGLDVFAREPLEPDSELLGMDQVVLTPHIGGMTSETRAATIEQLVENVRALVSGETIPAQYLATAG